MKIFADPQTRSIEGYISTILLFLMFMVVLLEIVLINLRKGLPWTNDASIWIWVWMIFMGFSELERTNQHLQADIIMNKFPVVVQNFLFLLTDILSAAILLHLIFIARKYIGFVWDNTPTTLTILPMGVLYSAFFVGAILSFIRMMLRISKRIIHYRNVTEA